MSRFEVRLEQSSFDCDGSGALTGRLHVLLEDFAYPEVAWNDFVVVVLSWWCESVLQVVNQTSGKVRLCFMDGLFGIDVSRSGSPSKISLEIEASSCFQGVRRRIDIPTILLVKEICEAGKAVLDYCDKHGIETDDVAILRENLALLESAC